MDTRYFSRFNKFHHEFDNIILYYNIYIIIGSRYSMMNIALGGHSNLVSGLCRSVGLTYSGFSGTFTQHVTLVSIPKSFLVGEDDIAIIVDKAKTLWRLMTLTTL